MPGIGGGSHVHADVGRPRPHVTAPFRATPHGRHAARRAARAPAIPAARLTAIVVLTGLAALLLIFQYQFRHLEAAAAARVYSVIMPTLAAPTAPVVWFSLGTPSAFGLVITPDCSSALLIVPLCVLGMGLAILRKLALRRVCAGLLAAAALLVTGNLVRIGLIAEMVRWYGIGTGYQLGHLVFGSLLSVVCTAASLATLTLIVSGRGTRWAARGLPHGRRRITA